jgi:radical SAM protein with 4Fe4S-binding SPASM domain
MGILSSGLMAMCGIGTQEKDLIYGQLGVNNVSDTWINNLGLIKLRKQIPEQLQGICNNCLFKNRCLGACVAHNYHAEKKLTTPFWFCEQAVKNGLFPVTRMRETK